MDKLVPKHIKVFVITMFTIALVVISLTVVLPHITKEAIASTSDFGQGYEQTAYAATLTSEQAQYQTESRGFDPINDFAIPLILLSVVGVVIDGVLSHYRVLSTPKTTRAKYSAARPNVKEVSGFPWEKMRSFLFSSNDDLLREHKSKRVTKAPVNISHITPSKSSEIGGENLVRPVSTDYQQSFFPLHR